MTKYQVLPDVDLSAQDVRDSKGRRITEEYAERATADALASVGRGGPSLTGAKAPSPQVTFRVTPELRARGRRRGCQAGSTSLGRGSGRSRALPRVKTTWEGAFRTPASATRTGAFRWGGDGSVAAVRRTGTSRLLAMAEVVLRVRLIGGDHLDVTYEEPHRVDPSEVIEHVITTLARDSGVLRTTHGDRLVVLYGRGIAALEVAPRGAVL